MSLVVIKKLVPKKPNFINIGFGMWCGISTIVGFNGMLIEHDRIQRYAYNQCGISKFEQHMESLDLHINAVIAYGVTFMCYPITKLYFHTSFFESIDSKRNLIPRLLLRKNLNKFKDIDTITKDKFRDKVKDIDIITEDKFKDFSNESYCEKIVIKYK